MASLSASTARDLRTASRDEVEEDIRKTLFKYQDAYALRSVDDVLKIAPFWTRAQLESEFSSFRTIQLDIQNVRIDLDGNRTGATVRCTIGKVSLSFDPNARPVTEKRAWQFQLAYTGGAWQITRADSR